MMEGEMEMVKQVVKWYPNHVNITFTLVISNLALSSDLSMFSIHR